MSTSLNYDGSYFRSISAILKISCLLCSFIGFLCILCSSVRLRNLRGLFYMVVVVLAFLCTSCSLLTGIFQLCPDKLNSLNAAKYETYMNGSLAFLTFIAAAVACSMDMLTYSLATFFGFFAASIYAYTAYLGYSLSRKCSVATQTQNA